MKNNKNYFGIYINNKIPKIKDTDNKINRYYRNIKLDFKGKAFIINKDNEKKELRLNDKYKKSGKYTIEFINERNEVYYININIIKLWPLLWLFFIGFFILLSSTFLNTDNMNKNYEIDKSLNFDVELDGLKYNFNVNYKNQNFKNIELTDKVTQSNMLYPGAYGSFYIFISTKGGNKDIDYIMQVQEETDKPINLKFKVNDIEYSSITELSKNIKGTIKKNSNELLKIDWFWDYNSDNVIDTIDGININSYNFSIRIIGSENI